MSSYLYKNMLIVLRGAQENDVGIHLVKNTYNIWFDKSDKNTGYESDNDKILIFYDDVLSTSDSYINIGPDWTPPSTMHIGYMHILAYNNCIKVTKCKFSKKEDLVKELNTLWQFIAESMWVYKVGDIDSCNYIIYWDMDTIGYIEDIIRNAGLLTNSKEFSHIFTDREIRIAIASSLPKRNQV